MDKKQIKEFIKQVAIIEEQKPKKDPNIRLDDDAEDLVRIGNEWVEVTAKSNPTLGFKFIKLKETHKVCELGCGDIVTNQVIEKRLCLTPEKHWRTKCNNCGCFVSPDGESFIEGGHQIQAAYIRHFNALRGIVEKVKPKLIPKSPTGEITEYENNRPSRWITDTNGNITLKGG